MDIINSYPARENHIQHLEKVVQESLDALELCAFFEKRQNPLNEFNSQEELFDNAVATLQKVVPIRFYGVYLVDEKTMDLYLAHSCPEGYSQYLQDNLENFIDNGTVAWAMRENRTVVSFSYDHKYDVLLHALETNQKSHGLISCFLEKNTAAITSWNSILLTIIMRSTAYALENFHLYKQLDDQNEKLNDTIDQLNSEIKKKEAIEEQLRESEIIYRNIFENTGNATIIIDNNGLILLSNSQFLAFSKYTREELEKIQDIFHFFPQESHCAIIQNLLTSHPGHSQALPQEFLFQDSEGNQRFVLLYIHSLGIDNKYILSFSDISKIKQAEKELNFQAFHDTLTQLPNRALLEKRLSQAVKKAYLQADYNYAVLFIDIDRLKIINDTLGHNAGDEMIKQTSERLRTCIRDVDTVARFGGDEFVILLEGVHNARECEIVLQRIYREFHSPLNVGGREMMLTLSTGIFLGDRQLQDSEEIIRCADLAMYQAKKLGRNKYIYHNEQECRREENNLYLENELSKAIQSDSDIFLTYQPILNLHSGAIYGLEVLTRWNHTQRGMLSPGKFIPIAENTGLMVPLGKKILSMAFSQFCAWLEAYPDLKEIFLCLNLSVNQLLQGDIVANISDAAAQAGMPLENIHLEITESVFIDEATYASAVINELKEKGIHVSIDDFGTGYSSLRYLDQFAIDLIKIDKELVQKITTQNTSYSIVESMLSLNQKLGIQVVAEGIENVDQLRTLQRMECHLGQGFLFSRPMTSRELEQYFSRDINHCLLCDPSRELQAYSPG
jgi:diguanylate cyclase (GGDEF)-like protein/PAS domain S-box-containing protein